MTDAAYERWLSQFVGFGEELLTRAEWEAHPANPNRKRRKPGKPTAAQVAAFGVQLYPHVPARRNLP